MTLTPTLRHLPLRHLPPRRLLAIAASLVLIGGQADAKSSANKRPKASMDGSEVVCPLGVFHCPPRPDNYAICRPNAMLEFYDPTLSKDSSQRETANTLVSAENFDTSDQTVYHLIGRAKMDRADQRLQANRVDYNTDTTDYDARGNVRYQEATQLLAASHMRGNTTSNTGIADDVRYQMLNSHGNGVATQAQMFDAQHGRYNQATYSTCDVGHHLWEIRAKSIRTDKITGVGAAHNATLRFHNVPFFYTPYMTFPLDDRRKSGFLFPTVGGTGRAGFMLSTPYYLNLAPNYDATIDPRLYVNRGPMLGGEFRYLNVARSTGTLDFQYLANDRDDDRKVDNDPNALDSLGRQRYLVKFTNNTQLWSGWSFNTNINRASDSSYLRDFGDDLYTSSIGQLSSSAYVNGSGKWGKTSWSTSFGADDYQNVDPSLPDSSAQYRRWPRATLNLDTPINRWLEFGMTNEAVAFRKGGSVEGKRLDMYPYLAADFEGPAWFVRPKLAYRYTAYQLSGGYENYGYSGPLSNSNLVPADTPFTDKSPSRALPIVSLDSGLIFERDTSLFGSGYTQTLEPRLYYLYVPYRNQNNIPLFDTTLMSFDYWQLFSPNQFSGGDRQMNANNLTGALTTRLLDDKGVERVSLSFGQIRYLTRQRVQVPNGPNTVFAPTNYNGSDYVVQLNSQLSDQWRLNTAYQWSPNTHQTDLGAFELQHRLGKDGVLNFSYRFRRQPGVLPVSGNPQANELLKQYDVSAVYPVSDRWRLIGHWTYSVLDHQTVDSLAGVQYEGCCMKVSLVGRHYVTGYDSQVYDPNNSGGTNNAVMLEIEFKGLGAFNAQQEEILHRGILGYQ